MFVLVLTLGLGCNGCSCGDAVSGEHEASAQPNLEAVETALMNDLEPRPEQIEVWPIAPAEGVFLGVYEWIPGWTGEFAVFGFGDDHVTWVAAVADPPREQTIDRARVIRAQGHDSPLIEVVGLTHMGNGSLYIYRLDDRALVLLLKVPVLDQHDDGVVFEPDHHRVRYFDRNGDSIADVEISGTVVTTGDGQPAVPVSRSYLWDPRVQRFSLARELR